MKIPSSHTLLHSALAVLAGGLLFSASTQAAISGINTPGTSLASINFDDTASFSPPPGTTNITPNVSPWNGALFSLPFTTDGTTFDTAQGDIAASFLGNTYAITFTNVLLQQSLLNTGFAKLVFQFNVEFQLDGAGLPLQATLYPIFNVTGTVQIGGFAFVSGLINYNGLNADGTANLLDTVTYNASYVTPGAFSSPAVLGVPGGGTTAALAPNSTLTLDGVFTFIVDPASISANSVMVPEPSSALLALLSLPLLLRRRRA